MGLVQELRLVRRLTRPAAQLGLACVIAASQLSPIGTAAVSAAVDPAPRASVTHCAQAADAGACPVVSGNGLDVGLPDGGQQCPASGEGASCMTSGAGALAPGAAATPPGQTPCPASGSPLSTPAACSDPASPSPGSNDKSGAPANAPSVEPSVPVSTLRPAASVQELTLSSSVNSTSAGGSVLLTAAAPVSVTGTGNAIEIFDTTTASLVGSCSQGGQCSVAYAADSGVHRFQAFLGAPTETVPSKAAASSNTVSVGWVGVTVASTAAAVGAGKSMTLTATSTVPVEQFGYVIALFDAVSAKLITFCSRGTHCSVSISQPISGSRSIVAAVGAASESLPPSSPAESDPLSLTWLSVTLAGSAAYRIGGTIHLDAGTNADLTDTPWSLGIVDDSGHLVGAPCKTGSTCSADVTMDAGTTPRFTAVVGSVPQPRTVGKVADLLTRVAEPTSLIDIQARSAAVQPARLLWGVDSCKAITGDPTGELYGGVAGGLGAPDFWGRYLTTTVCPALSASEVALAKSNHMGLLPIYNDYNCSAVVGYDTAMGYAQAAVAAAQSLQIPTGRVIAVDIEPPGDACPGAANVDAGFVQGWYDGITAAGYIPVYYGNGTAGSEFANAWCAAQAQQTAIAQNSYIWSFEPSLDSGGWSKGNPPGWQPYETGCPDRVAAWQYQIDIFSPNPNIDSDLALSTLPLWFP